MLPLDYMINHASAKMMAIARFSKLARFYRLFRLFRIIRMVRLFRLLKDRQRIASQAREMIELDSSIGRLIVFLATLFLVCHVLACLWVLAAISSDGDNWIVHSDKQGIPNSQLYVTSFYFVTTTVTTVGYGDICPRSITEKIFAIFMLFVGVFTFSFSTGALASIFQSYDNSQASLN